MSCHSSLSKTILQGTLDGGRCCGQQRKCWMDNIKEWTSLPMSELLTRAPAEKTGGEFLLNRPSCPPNDPISQGAELNWTVPLMMLLDRWALHLSASLFSSWSGCWQYNVVGVVSARNLSGSRNKCSIKLDLCVFIFYPSSPPPHLHNATTQNNCFMVYFPHNSCFFLITFSVQCIVMRSNTSLLHAL